VPTAGSRLCAVSFNALATEAAGSELDKWLTWATGYADSLAPLISSDEDHQDELEADDGGQEATPEEGKG
jgi:hypothetical protein